MSYSLSLEKYAGKVAVVTGASAGIGKAIAEALVKHGVVVAGVARRLDKLEELAAQLKGEKGQLHAFQCDLTKQEEILATFQKITTELGPIHILINNAGLLLATSIIDGDIEKWKPVLDTNVLAVAICIREAVASMKKNNIKGHIVNINSVAGHGVGDFPMQSLYPASKHALTALTETVRLEINREKLPIKITSISPGIVTTEFAAVAFGQLGEEEMKKLFAESASKLDKALRSEDVADSTLYVLSTPDHVNVKELVVVPQGQLL